MGVFYEQGGGTSVRRQEFDSVLARYIPKEVKEKTGETKKMIGVTSDQRYISEVGNKFVSLVANNFDKDFITYSDALSYLLLIIYILTGSPSSLLIFIYFPYVVMILEIYIEYGSHYQIYALKK